MLASYTNHLSLRVYRLSDSKIQGRDQATRIPQCIDIAPTARSAGQIGKQWSDYTSHAAEEPSSSLPGMWDAFQSEACKRVWKGISPTACGMIEDFLPGSAILVLFSLPVSKQDRYRIQPKDHVLWKRLVATVCGNLLRTAMPFLSCVQGRPSTNISENRP